MAVRLCALPPSVAGGERVFKALKAALNTRRSHLSNERADSETRVVFNLAQLRRGDVLGSYRRPDVEYELRAMVNGETGTGAPAQAPPPAVDSGDQDGSSDRSESDAESTSDIDGAADDLALREIFYYDGVDAAVDFLLT